MRDKAGVLLECPACGKKHDWEEGRPLTLPSHMIRVIVCDRVPQEMLIIGRVTEKDRGVG